MLSFLGCIIAITWIAINEDPHNNSIKFETLSASNQVDLPLAQFSEDVQLEKKETLRDSILRFANKQLLVPYKYGSCEPDEGFDCSGFIYYVFQNFGIKIPRSSSTLEFAGIEKSIHQAEIGDILIFTGTDATNRSAGHVGIVYSIGDSIKFIHSSSGSANGVTVSSLTEPHYKKRFLSVRDLLAD